MKQELFVAIAVLAASSIAHADTIYTSESAWAAAVSGITTVNFEGIAPVNSYQAYSGSTVVGGLTFSTDGALFVIGDNFYGFGVATLSGQGPGTSNTDHLSVTLPTAVTAIGFDFIVDPGTVTVTLSDGVTDQLTAANSPSTLFFGVTAVSGITSVDISEPYSLAAASLNLSDFSYATANPVATPEPRSSILLVALLGAFGLVMHRRRRQAKTIG